MINGETRVRVYNKCLYNIGVKLLNNTEMDIPAGGFKPISADDILAIETNYRGHLFTKRKLVPADNNGNPIDLTEFGIYDDAEVAHLTEEEITAALKGSVKKLEEWLSNITEEAERHAIYEVAIKMDLPTSKLKLLRSKIPNKDWLDEMSEAE